MSQITEEPVRAVLDKLRHLSADDETRWLALARERALYDERTLLMEARAEGHVAGHAEGRAEGRAEGLAEGEQAALRRAAANMIRHTTLDDAAIGGITGLAAADIAALRDGCA